MKRYKTLTGIFSPEGRTVLYSKTEYFVRMAKGDVKFRTKAMTYDIANKANKAANAVVAIPVTKITEQKIGSYGEIQFSNVEEILTSESTLRLLMTAEYGYPLK